MKSNRINSLIQASITLGLLTAFTVSANALDFSIQIGTPPPRPPAPRFHAPPEPVYVAYYSDAVLNLGCGYFGLESPVVYAYSRDYNLSPDEVVYILYLSHYSHRSPIFVINVYQKYHRRGWSVMAKHLGIRGSYPRWMRDRNAPTLAVLYVTSDYYNVSYTQVRRLYDRGYQPAEIAVAVNVSSRSGRPVGDILGQRNKGSKWEDISRDNKVSMDDIKSPRGQGRSVKFGAPLQEKAPAQGLDKKNNPNMPNQSTQDNTKIRGFEKNDKEFKGKGNAYGREEFKGQQPGQGKVSDSKGKDKNKDKDKDKDKNNDKENE